MTDSNRIAILSALQRIADLKRKRIAIIEDTLRRATILEIMGRVTITID